VIARITTGEPISAPAPARAFQPDRHHLRDVQGIYFTDEPKPPGAKLAFVFPGEGSQYLGMLADLCMQFPEVREHFDAVDRIFKDHARNFVPSDFIFPRPVFSEQARREAEERLWQMEGAFEAVLTADWALYGLLRRLSVSPDAILGHSTGEYAAMRAAGMMKLDSESDVADFARQLNDFYRRPGASEKVVGASLVAVGAGVAAVTEVLASSGAALEIAMDNCPHQTVVVGSETEVEKFLGPAKERGWFYERLAFDARNRPGLILALALIHHICLSSNVPIPDFLDWLAGTGAKLIIEFVDRDDVMVKEMLSRKTETHADYTLARFEEELRRRYTVIRAAPLKGGARKIYHCAPLRPAT